MSLGGKRKDFRNYYERHGKKVSVCFAWHCGCDNRRIFCVDGI